MDHPPTYTQSNSNSAHGSPLVAPSPVQGATPGTPGTPRTPGTPVVPELILPSALPLQPHGSTPAPSDDHPDMVSHPSQILLEDEDDQAYEDRQRASRGRARYHHSHSQGGSPFSSRPNSPSPPPPLTTASTFLNNHSLANSVSTSPSSYSAEGPSTSALQHALSFFGHHSTPLIPPPSGSTAGNSHAHTHTDQYPSSASSSKTLRIELSNPEVVLQTGQSTRMEGILYVNLHKPTKVKTLTLEFSGRSSVTWVDGKHSTSHYDYMLYKQVLRQKKNKHFGAKRLNILWVLCSHRFVLVDRQRLFSCNPPHNSTSH